MIGELKIMKNNTEIAGTFPQNFTGLMIHIHAQEAYLKKQFLSLY